MFGLICCTCGDCVGIGISTHFRRVFLVFLRGNRNNNSPHQQRTYMQLSDNLIGFSDTLSVLSLPVQLSIMAWAVCHCILRYSLSVNGNTEVLQIHLFSDRYAGDPLDYTNVIHSVIFHERLCCYSDYHPGCFCCRSAFLFVWPTVRQCSTVD